MVRFLSMIALVAVLLAGVLALPIDLPYTITTVGKVLPAAEWVLVRDQDGSIGTLLRNHLDGTLRNADVHRFDRGDAVSYRLHPALRARSAVAVGDTVLQIRSNETARLVAVARGEVAAADAELSLHATGEKQALVERAERNVARAIEQVEQQRRRLERLRTLRERQLISEQDLEDATSQMEIFQAEADMALADLEAVRSGSKPEQVRLAEAQTEARRLEMQTLADRLSMQTIRAPISGVAVRSFGSDTLLTIRDTSAAVIVMPISWSELETVSVGQTVHVDAQHAGDATGRIIEIGETIKRLGGDQVVMVTARLEHVPAGIIAGGVVTCRIETDPVRLLEYVRRKVL